MSKNCPFWVQKLCLTLRWCLSILYWTALWFQIQWENKASKNLFAHYVIDCVSEINNWSDKEVVCDSYLSFISLTKVIKEEDIRAIGTVRADRLRSLKVKKTDVTKQGRDTIDTFFEKKWNICGHLEWQRPSTCDIYDPYRYATYFTVRWNDGTLVQTLT